ncbi:MATE family efflux transporter [Paenibacillus sp. NFR01]|uniref:MATE family efflux transporter n=1 Tax=Paenibacillus sp. NFR01 TaxID=1566279 RepID=UPI0008D52919|nr:MATE family efflux transporter [Paenibacillus sp. NFR01]SET90867.1 putative efflux protein, MATE family [Paenibacillus sp. NFR01]
MQSASNNKTTGLWQLSWPIGIELLLQFLMGTLDTMMVSRLGDQAVSGVGVANQIIQTAMTLFTVINAGAGAILARMWGAGEWEKARKTAAIAIKINLAFGLAGGLFFVFASGPVLRLMGIPAAVSPYAGSYLTFVGGGMAAVTLQLVINALIRNTGNTKGPMLITLGMNLLHLGLNYGLIFGRGPFPALGVEGTAISTVVSRLAALVFALQLLWKTFTPRMQRSDWRGMDRGLLKEILGIGLPVSVTAMSWGFSQIVLLSILSSMGPDTLASYTYVQTVEQFPWMLSSAIGSALAIQIGHAYGAGRHDLVYKGPVKAIAIGTALALATSTGLWIAGRPVLRAFISSPDILDLSVPLLAVCILWQALRVNAFCLSGSLNIIGEARPVAVLTVIGMWLISTGGAYLLGVSAGWGVAGVLAAMILDEAVRGAYFAHRWRRRRPTEIHAAAAARG